MPDSNLARVAAWLAEEERKKRDAEDQPEPQPRPESTKLVSLDSAMPGKAEYFRYDVDGNGILRGKEGTIPDDYLSSLTGAGYKVADAASMQAARAAAGQGRPPPGKLPFISGTPTHEATKPAFAYMPTVARLPGDDMRPLPLQRSYAGMMGAMSSIPKEPAKKADPKATLAKARGRREVEVRSTSEGVQPALRAPVDPLASRPAAPALPERVSSFLQGRRAPSGLEDAQRRASINQLSANLGQSAEYLAAGVGGVRPRAEAYSNLQAQADQPVEQYQQLHAEQRQQEQDEAALAEAQREAERAAQEFQFKQGRAAIEDQLARDRLAQERAIAEGRLRSDAADRGLRREEMRFRQKEGQELKQQLADQRQQERQAREDELDLQRLGAATSKAPFGEFQAALEEVDRLVPGLPYGQVPTEAPLGMGDRVARALSPVGGEFFMSDKGKAYATAIANLRDLVARMRSGAVLNAGEERHYLSLLGDRALSDERTAAQGINAVRQGIAQKLRNAQSGFQNVLPRYEATGATTYRAPIFGDTAPPRPTGKKITRPDGSVWQELDNGEAEMVQPPTRRQ